MYQQILNDEGDLHFKTDNRGLFAYSLESMSQFGMYFTKINLNLHQEDDGSNILTEYEKKFSDKGSRIYRMEAKFHSQNKALMRVCTHTIISVFHYNGSIDKAYWFYNKSDDEKFSSGRFLILNIKRFFILYGGKVELPVFNTKSAIASII